MVNIGLIVATVTVSVIVYGIIRFLIFYKEVRRRAKFLSKLPAGDQGHPLFGHVFLVPDQCDAGLEWIAERVEEVCRLAGIWFGPFVPTVSVMHPETVKAILKTSDPKPFSVGAYRMAYPWLGNGLLIAAGKKWARNRRLLTPAFHFDILKPYMKVNHDCAQIMLNKISKYSTKNESFEVFGMISQMTLDIILRCAFSHKSDCQIEGDNHPYVMAITELADTMVHRMLRPWLYPDFIFYMTPLGRKFKQNCDYVHGVSNDVIKRRRQALKAGEGRMRESQYLDFLDILLTAKDEDGNGLTEREIRDEVDTFLFEGHDTTASGISWALYDLATNPDWQEKVQDEVDDVLKDRDSDEILWDDLGKLKTLTMCLRESLRLHSPVPFIERQTTKDMEIDGFFLPSGTVVDIQLYAIHHNPHVWKEPLKFNPERFSGDSNQLMDSFAFVPFSAGPRNCIGQNFAMHEMKTVIASLMHKFNLYVDTTKKVGHRIMVVMKTENGMYMKASPRVIAA